MYQKPHQHQEKQKIKKRLSNVSENYEILRTSWHVQTKVFFEHSTLHGVRYIAENGRPFLEKFMWFACVAIGTVTTTVIIMSLWEKFQTNPTITGLDTDFHNWDVPFPAIIACQEFPTNITKIQEYIDGNIKKIPFSLAAEEVAFFFNALTRLSFNTMRSFTELNSFREAVEFLPENTDIKSLIFELVNRCEDIFDSCEFKSDKYNCCEGFFPVFTEIGFCYAFNSRHYEKKIPGRSTELGAFKIQYISETDIKWALKFEVKDTEVKMPIYILNSDEQAGIDVQPQHVWEYRVDKISFSVKQTYTTEDTKQLSIKQRHCVFPDEIKLSIDHIYTYSACTRQCRMDNAMKLCQCVPHFYPAIGHYRHCKITELECIAKHLSVIKSVAKCDCNLGCSNTVYEVEKLNEVSGQTDELEAQFVSWPMVRYKREVLFGWVDLLVSFGGIAGLFLGFSLLSGVEIIYYFTLRALCMALKEREELERINYEEKSRPPRDYDLSLVPYFISEPYPGSGMNEVAKNYYQQYHSKNPKKIAPIHGHIKVGDHFLPPFGIEFMN